MTPQVTSKGPASAPCIFFARNLEPQGRPEKAPGRRCAVFYKFLCTPKRPEVDPVLFFTSILGPLALPPGYAARRRPPAQPAKPGGEQRWKTLEPILGHVRKKVSRRRRPKRKRCTIARIYSLRDPGRAHRQLWTHWLLATGCWLLVAGCWLLVTGCWLLAAGYRGLEAGIRTIGCWSLAVDWWLAT